MNKWFEDSTLSLQQELRSSSSKWEPQIRRGKLSIFAAHNISPKQSPTVLSRWEHQIEQKSNKWNVLFDLVYMKAVSRRCQKSGWRYDRWNA
uniref:Uncharacterized protein n=1 Tax=Nelumbo nucifera TaxID=4432 RepID=A0A822Z3E9_NELNU|nr:TPA_asm: hypothetical protein HUJ06_013513 [Nelumbo nucifera]